MKTPLLTLLISVTLLMANNNLMAQAKITHIAVHVENITRSAEFYKNVFQFPELDEPFKDGVHVWLDMGNKVAMHIIQAPWKEPTINKNNHICFSVKDMDSFISNLDKHGVEYEDWPGNKGEINIRPDGIKQIYLQDPDGYWVEINDEY